MDRYKLLGLDQMEASIVRRHLHQWNKADEQVITPLIAALQQGRCLSNLPIREPRWETNVYPLYYYWAYHHKVSHKKVYDRVFASLRTTAVSVPEEDLRTHVARVVNTEIDILVEDVEYFVFIEAKVVAVGQKVKFEKIGGVHQLVRQYIQGRILETLTGKTFALATIGANNEQPIKIPLNPTERDLLRLVDEERQSLEIPDLAWTLLSATAQAAGTA